MKKILILFFLFFIVTNSINAEDLPVVTGREKVNLYLFRSNGCIHCENAVNYLNSLEGKYDEYINIIIFEVSDNENNLLLYNNLIDDLDMPRSGVPFVVVANNYSTIGFTGTSVIKAAIEAYEDDSSYDIVNSYLLNGNYEKETLHEACINENIIYYTDPLYINESNSADNDEINETLESEDNDHNTITDSDSSSALIIIGGCILFCSIGIIIIIYKLLKNKKMTEI